MILHDLITATTGIVVEIDGLLYGPFETREVAFAWAMRKGSTPFKMHVMLPPRLG